MPGPARARLTALMTLMAVAAAIAAGGEQRLNEIQLLGSHNSYKLAMDPDRMATLGAVDAALAESLDYAHLPLERQLQLGLRALELDVFYDAAGRLFERGRVPGTTARSEFPVLHVQNLDDRSSCGNVLHCLSELVAWSSVNPGHVPVFVSFNAKDDVIEQPGFLRPEPFTERAWMALDAELRSVLGDRLLTPAEAFAGGVLRWPSLAEARGRFVLVLDEGGAKLEQYASRWRERAMFANLPEDAPGAAILVVNDPLAQFERIRALVRAGFIVRTRADADTREARSGSVERRDAAFASGAQLVSTDYYLPDDRFGHRYQVTVPGGAGVRCNPLLRPGGCVVESSPAAPQD